MKNENKNYRRATKEDIKRAQDDPTYLGIFVEKNKGLVKKAMSQYFRSYCNCDITEDLHQEGYIGLVKAVRKFDFSYNVEFSTYAIPMINGEIKRYLRDKIMVINVSRDIRSMYAKYRALSGKGLSIEECAQEMETTVEEIERAIYIMSCADVDCLNGVIHEDEGSPITLQDKLSNDFHLEGEAINNLHYESLIEYLKKNHPSNWHKVVEYRLQDLPQGEIGELLGISQVQVSRILEKIKTIFLDIIIKKKSVIIKEKPKSASTRQKEKPLANINDTYDMIKSARINNERMNKMEVS